MIERARIPVANSITAMEVWLLACIVLVFLTLVEYAVILREEVLIKRNKRKALSTTSTTLFELKKENLSNPSSVNSIHHQIEKSQEAIQVGLSNYVLNLNWMKINQTRFLKSYFKMSKERNNQSKPNIIPFSPQLSKKQKEK